MSMFEIYLVMQADSVDTALTLGAFLSLVYPVFIFISWVINKDREGWYIKNPRTWPEFEKAGQKAADWQKKFPLAFIVVIVLWTASALMPSTKTLVTMVGLHEITQSEEAMKLPENMLKVLNGYLEEYIEAPKETTK